MNTLEYLLSSVGEEASEVGQAASKCNRFTPEHAYYETSNLARLQDEVTDLVTTLRRLEPLLGYTFKFEFSEAKSQRIDNMMKISREMGTLV